MGLMMRRRRPLMRVAAGAAVAGTAYHMGKKGEQQAQVNDQAQAAYAATQQAPPPRHRPTHRRSRPRRAAPRTSTSWSSTTTPAC